MSARLDSLPLGSGLSFTFFRMLDDLPSGARARMPVVAFLAAIGEWRSGNCWVYPRLMTEEKIKKLKEYFQQQTACRVEHEWKMISTAIVSIPVGKIRWLAIRSRRISGRFGRAECRRNHR